MNRIDYKLSKAPILDGIFDRFAKTGNLNYCMICLRTERRLVKNRNFRKFSSAMKLDKERWQHNQICYMCERQASNALKFFNAVTFAATIDTIFSEIVYEKRNNSTDVIQESTFNQILKKCGLSAHKSSSLEWALELEAIRNTTQFVETLPIVVDNLASNMPKPNSDLTPAAADQLYVIPDNPPSLGQVMGISSHCMGVAEYPSIQETVGQDSGTSKDDLALMFQSEPNISETLVILEDEEDNPPLQIRIDSVVSNAADPPQPSTHPHLVNLLPKLSNPHPLALMTPNSQSPVLVPKEVFTGDSLLIGTPGGTYTLHPIAIKDGITRIPSLGANLINGRLFYDKIPNVPPIITSMDMNQLKLNAPSPVFLNDVFAHTNVASPQNLFVNVVDLCKTTKRESPGVECATPNKMYKGLPVEKECASEKSDRIDWEDKIPMDVISYMDAVDPLGDPRLSKKGRRPVTSDRASIQEGSPDVIDLC